MYNYIPFLATRYLSLAWSLLLMTSLTSTDGGREAVGTSVGAFTGWGLRALSLASLLEPDSSWISEKAMATHSSTLAWKIPWTEEPGRLQSMLLLWVGHNWATSLSLFTFGEGHGNPLQCSSLENPRDGGAWWAAIYGVAQSQTWLKRLSSSSSSSSWNIYKWIDVISEIYFKTLWGKEKKRQGLQRKHNQPNANC